MIVRECRHEDVAALERQLPTGRNRYHDDRYRRQCEGLSTYLVAWQGDVPVGAGEVLWQGAKEPEVRDRFPDCPEINGAAVTGSGWASTTTTRGRRRSTVGSDIGTPTAGTSTATTTSTTTASVTRSRTPAGS